MKLANVIAGLQSHSSQHPCCYCEGTAGIWEEDARLRTISNIRNNRGQWIRDGSRLSEAKNFKNCVNEPLLQVADDELILLLIPPPELHLLMGAFNTLYKEMKKIWPAVDTWTEKLYMKPTGFHGSDNFIGGDCYRALRNIDLLAAMCPLVILPFVEALRKLLLVVESCFGAVLQPRFRDHISAFENSYNALEISVTPKIHILTRHVPQFCDHRGESLGRYSEQASEAVHSLLKVFWQKRKINNFENVIVRED